MLQPSPQKVQLLKTHALVVKTEQFEWRTSFLPDIISATTAFKEKF